MKTFWAAAAVCGLLGACGPSLPEPYLQSRAAAERAYAHGRYDEAAAHWRDAAANAARKKDRADALYRHAASLRRAGKTRQAKTVVAALVREYP
ncbi:MAG TPA: hypothetical protein PKA88_20245, partial [Polyangiaceae bacterium]|nr:hypothetical protein [Polyangiaceae bacterium]